MASYTALMNIQVDSQQAQLGINNLNKNLTYLSRSSRLTNKSLLQMQQTFLRIENTINQATGNTAAFNGKMQQAMNIIKKLRGEVSSLRSEVTKLNDKLKGTQGPLDKSRTLFERLGLAIQKNQYFASLAVSAFAGFISQNLITGIIRLTDEYTLMQNKIKTVTPTLEGAKSSMEAVYQIAQDTRQPLSIVANMFSRIGRNSKELRENLAGLTDVVGTVSKAFQIGGATIEESRNAMVQFSQALASGRLQGDELRSILELAPVLATSISKSIGITTGSLRKLASEGLITSEVLIKALFESGKAIREDFQKMMPTVEQSVETVKNSFTRLIGENEKFKAANNALSLSLRDFSRALEEQGGIADQLGSVYLGLARNIDTIAAAVVGLTTAIAGLAILGVGAIAAANPIVAVAFGITALVSGFGAYIGITKSAEERTKNLAKEIDKLSSVSDEDVSKMSKEDSQKRLSDIMKAQSETVDLVRKEQSLIEEINQELEKGEKEIEKQRSLGSSEIYIEHMRRVQALENKGLLDEKKMHELRLEDFKKYLEELNRLYDEQIKIEEGKALELMLARTRAMEMQKRLLKEQERDEQISYFGSFGSGASEKQLKDIQFANKAAQDLRKTLSDLQMSTLDTAFVGRLSVETLFGSTDPAAAVENLKGKITEFIQLTETDPAGGIVQFFTNYMGEEGKKQIEEISTKLKEQPYLAKGIKEGMITVWKEALANYEIYKAERDAGEERYLNLLLKDMNYEYQEMYEELLSKNITLGQYLQEGVTIHNKEKIAIENKLNLEKILLRLQMEKDERSEEAILAAQEELESRRELYKSQLALKNAEEAINKILQNRERIFENQSRARAEVSVGGPESYGGATGMDGIGSSIRDTNIEYQMQIDLLDRIYKANAPLLKRLKDQEAAIRDQNVQRVIANKLESEKLNIEKLKQEAYFVRLQSEMKQSGATDLEVELRLIEEKTNLELSSYATMLLTDKITDDQYQKLKNITIEKDRQLKQLAEEEAKRRALEQFGGAGKVGEAAIKGISALFDKDFYAGLYNGLVSGTKYLIDGIKEIDWENFADYFSDKIKGIDWKGIATNLGEWFKSGSGLLDALASAGGASGQRALGIKGAAEAGALVGGPIGAAGFALGQAILSNEKVQAALSKLFDAVFEFIDPFLDLLGPVVDIFTAMVKNNPIMTAVNALKPLLNNLSSMLSALAKAIETLDLSQQGGTLGYIFGGGLASDIEDAFNSTFLGGGEKVLSVEVPKLEKIMGEAFVDKSAGRIMSGQMGFQDVYSQTEEAYTGVMQKITKRVVDKYMNNPFGGKIPLTYKTITYYQEMSAGQIAKKAKEAVRKVLNSVLDGIEEETASITKEAEELNKENKSAVAGALDSITGVRNVMKELEFALQFLPKNEVEEARRKMQEWGKAQEELFEAIVGSEIRKATEDLEESVLTFQRMATDPLTQSTVGLDSFTNQVKEFQDAIDEVSDPVKKAALQENLKAFTDAFEFVSASTANQQISDISLRGYDLTPEQELTLKYEKEIADVRAQENLTVADKIRVINALNEAREREVAAMEREQELLNLRGAQSALAEILSTFERTVEGINDLIQSLYDQVQDLLFGEFNLDPYLQKFELASDTYGTLLEAAFDPEATEDDIKKLQEFVNTYLGTARDLYKSSSTFQQIFSNVLSDLSVLGVQAGFNMPTAAVGTATSGIQEFIDATEDLSEELSGTLNDLIFDLNDLGMTFAQQKIDLIQDGMNIPLKITNDMIVVDLGDVNQTLTLTDENFTLDLTKLDLAASFEEITFTPNFGEVTEDTGWQDYEKSATFSATITGWDPFVGKAEYSATATFSSETDTDPVKYGWTDYAKTASFSSILLGWDGLTNGGPYSGTATFTTNVATEEEKIAAGFKEYSAEATVNPTFTLGDYTSEVIVYATLQKEFTRLGETASDTKGFHKGYAKLDLDLKGTMTTSSGSPKQYYGYADLYPSLTGMSLLSYNPKQFVGYAVLYHDFSPPSGGAQTMSLDSRDPTKYFGYATFDFTNIQEAISNAQTDLQSEIDSFSLTMTLFAESFRLLNVISQAEASGIIAAGPGDQGIKVLTLTSATSSLNTWGGKYFEDTAIGGIIVNMQDNVDYQPGALNPGYQISSELTPDQQFASVYNAMKENAPQFLNKPYYVLLSAGSRSGDTESEPKLAAFDDISLAENFYEYMNKTTGYYGWGAPVYKYGFQKGGLVPGPMDIIPAMLAPGEYIMSQGAVNSLGIGTLNSLNAGDLSALRQTGDPEVRSLLRELIIAVKTSDTEVNVYTDMKGEAKAAIGEFRTELRERSRRQGEKYVNVRYV